MYEEDSSTVPGRGQLFYPLMCRGISNVYSSPRFAQRLSGSKEPASLGYMTVKRSYQGYMQGNIVLPEWNPHGLPQPCFPPAVTHISLWVGHLQ